MITLFVALYSLFSLRTAVKTSDIKELHVKTVKRGENVTMECSMSKDKNKNNLAWYRQSFGKVPQYFVRLYGQNNYNFVDEFKDSHFSMTVNDQKFDLNINGTREDDGGEYFCGEVEGIIIKFTSGTRLQFEGEEMKHCPTPGTVNINTDSVTGSNEGSKSSDGKVDNFWIIVLTTSIIISLIVIVFLLGVLYKNQRKGASNDHPNNTNQADDEDVLNYAAVSFAKKPSSSRASRDKSHEDVYAQVKIK
ncbi:novel immune-type receptor 6 isoform X1 [Ictalurus punctatus]|uniref:Novel immune-type receptor 6 isoform X1 n=1 Tax=Ictalurus punctatus TaxID=7998 RepID=A0A2D0PWE9_ICTPU|nr:novel immune-type receptor 6 isoform X1 [Ictalurus punctatus]